MNHRLKNRQPQIHHRTFIYDRHQVCGKIYGKSTIGFGPMADLDTSAQNASAVILNCTRKQMKLSIYSIGPFIMKGPIL